MTALRRSIRFKIFAIAAALLLAMIAASIWSAWSTARVNRQLGAFSEALFPMALTLEELRAEMVAEQSLIDDQGRRVCRGGFEARAAGSQKLIEEARGYRARGAALAQLEHNRLKFAELAPMLSVLDAAHEQLIVEVRKLCASSAAEADAQELLARTRVGEIERNLTIMARDLKDFVSESFRVVEANEQRALLANLTLVGTAALVGLYLAFVVARGLTVPIHRLRDGALAARAGRLDSEVAITTADEIADVTRAFNAMLADLREKEEIKTTFGQYVDPRIVSRLIGAEAARSVAGEKQRVTVFFSDLVGFTPIADRLTPAGLVTVMNAYFTEMSEAIRARSGIVDKYIGDAVMAFWVSPFVSPEMQAVEACAAALDQQARLAAFCERLPDLTGLRRDFPQLRARMGISTGDAIVGSIGSDVARSFTVMGDVVNAGSRLEGANRLYGTRILIDTATRAAAGDAIVTRLVDHVVLKGMHDPVAIHELLAMRDGNAGAHSALIESYEYALTAYACGDWAGAYKGFAESLDIAPGDMPAQVMLDRVERFAAEPPAVWDGVWRLQDK